jgi:hypothetical protein
MQQPPINTIISIRLTYLCKACIVLDISVCALFSPISRSRHRDLSDLYHSGHKDGNTTKFLGANKILGICLHRSQHCWISPSSSDVASELPCFRRLYSRRGLFDPHYCSVWPRKGHCETVPYSDSNWNVVRKTSMSYMYQNTRIVRVLVTLPLADISPVRQRSAE